METYRITSNLCGYLFSAVLCGQQNLDYIFINMQPVCFVLDSVDRTEQIKGASLVPKLALDVMEGEVNRLLLLTKSNIIPTPYVVPRKVSYNS
jgi:hypothetical protein